MAVTLLFDVMQMCCINWHKPDRLAWEGLIFHFPCMLCFVSVISIFSIAVLPSGIRETWWRLILGDTALFITGRLPDNNECRYKIVSFTRCVFYPILTKDIYIHLMTKSQSLHWLEECFATFAHQKQVFAILLSSKYKDTSVCWRFAQSCSHCYESPGTKFEFNCGLKFS